MNAALEPIAANLQSAPDWASRTAVASLRAVTKRYRNGVTALDHLSLELLVGEIVVLLGPNGAGKSTAVKLMMGLTSPTGGQVRVFGADPRFAGNRQRIGVMLQVGRAPEMLRVREHIEIMRGYYPRPLPLISIVRAAGLEGLESRMFGHLSGGQKQRVLFALAIAGDADLIFLDEPTVGLDVEARRGLWAQIRALRQRGKTVLLTTHYLEEADALADRIILIDKGRVICEGTPNEVKAMGSKRTALTADAYQEQPDAQVTGFKILKFETTLKREQILTLSGVTGVEGATGFVTVTSSAPELTLRELLALDPNLSRLQIQTPGLEDAFLALTGRD
ncbi:MAG TPA: ABC transporter ATP-binding protein [Candidatus Aquilonibacter sp.]|nr:ABC transporter ATP-binding protein [Candidatus Aquilonibacter sp.]